jgi:cellulose synthase/poly-beta-1,6-N-acetylglucosamine synthase-like glycosyltransferase
MDADTVVFPDTIRMMLQEFREHDRAGAVCARYWAQAGSGPAWRLQRIEYARYDDARDLRSWRVQVASGAAAMYRSRTISEVLEATGRTAPWDGESLIEDYALSLDMRALNWETRAAAGAHVLTDTPQTFKELWNQRLRWGRGGVDEVRKRGWKRYMLMDIAGYGLYALGMLGRLLFLTQLVILIFTGMGYSWSWLGLIPIGIMAAARITSFLRLNGRQAVDYAIVVPILVEDFYGFFLEWCAAVSIYKSFRSARQSW